MNFEEFIRDETPYWRTAGAAFTNKLVDPPILIHKATNDAQRWNDLLAITCGAMEITKCKFHLTLYFAACSGAPVLNPLTNAID